MTHTTEQNSIRVIETIDIIASKHVIKEKRCRTAIREAYFSEALCECLRKNRHIGDST